MKKVKQYLLVILLLVGANNLIYAEEIRNLLIEKSKKAAMSLGYDGAYILTSPLRMDGKDVKKLLLVSGISYGLMPLENKIQNGLINTNYDQIGNIVEPLGVTNRKFYLAMGSLYVYGLISNDNKLKRTPLLLMESTLFNTTLTKFFKYTFGRARPSQREGEWDSFAPFSGHDAFPSGHTSTAFTIATVISNQYPSRLVKVSSYTIAGLVGLQRLHANVHGISDVFAGAILGIWVGNTVCSLDKTWTKDNIDFSLSFVSH
ncbi:MAG: phosphatase PAP2 family protein [bacterium]